MSWQSQIFILRSFNHRRLVIPERAKQCSLVLCKYCNVFFFIVCFCSPYLSWFLSDWEIHCAILLQYPIIQRTSKNVPVQSDLALAASILHGSPVSFYKLAQKISKHHFQLVQVCSQMCDDTACEYGALVGGECGSSTKYPSTEYARIGECNWSIERHFTDTLQAVVWTLKQSWY